MNRDGYVRLRPEGPLLGQEPSGPLPLLFVDVEPGAQPASLRTVPHEYFSPIRSLLVRGTPSEASEIEQLIRRIGLKAPTYGIRHEVGIPASICSTNGDRIDASDDDDLVPRARRAELCSLLQLGEAIWESKNFHFYLPSGRHARAFVRPAHAIRTIRDARAIALWLLSHVERTGTGIVVDTHTMSAVLLALQAEATQRDFALGPIRVLEGYPTTVVSAYEAVNAVTTPVTGFLGIISVCSSGTIRDRLLLAARDRHPLVTRADIVSIIDLNPAQSSPRPPGAPQSVSLVHLGDARRPGRFHAYDGQCPLCDNAETAPLVPVDVDTFDVRFPTFVERVMPSIRDPQRNQSLWEACDRMGALEYQASPDEQVQLWRPTGAMTWKVNWHTLLTDNRFLERCSKRLQEEVNLWQDERAKSGRSPEDWGKFDLVLVPARDVARPGFDHFWGAISPLFGPTAVTAFPDSGDWDNTPLAASVATAKRILIMTLGTVTGTTLQRALNEVQRTRKDANYVLHGLVIHGRPARRRAWEVLVNSYAGRLITAYLTHVPDDTSPLLEEAKHLMADSGALSEEAQLFLTHRLAVCRGEPGLPKHGFLWGAAPDERISPHSLFGDQLLASTTLLAAGSAIHAQREAKHPPPYRILFELPAIARSYYDPVIFACMLRWLRRAEIWWGGGEQAVNALNDIFARTNNHQKPLVLGELLLASAQGKLPANAVEVVAQAARNFLALQDCADIHRGMLEFGLYLARRADRDQKR